MQYELERARTRHQNMHVVETQIHREGRESRKMGDLAEMRSANADNTHRAESYRPCGGRRDGGAGVSQGIYTGTLYCT